MVRKGSAALRDGLPVRPRAWLAGFAGCRGIRLIHDLGAAPTITMMAVPIAGGSGRRLKGTEADGLAVSRVAKRSLTARRVCGCLPGSSRPALSAAPLIRAAMAGSRRSLSRQRRRFGPMLPTGMFSLALIVAYGRGGPWMSRVISRWQHGGSRASASRSAAWRSAVSSCCPAAEGCWSAMVPASGG